MLEYLDILQPRHVPEADALRGALSGSIRERFCAIGLRSTPWPSVRAAAEDLFRFLNTVPQDVVKDRGADDDKDDDIHDDFFQVRRVDGDRAIIFLRTIVRANWLFLHDIAVTQSRLPAATLTTLDDAFKALEAWMLGIPEPAAARMQTWDAGTASGGSMDRWIVGHQVFAAITQGLIAAVVELRAALGGASATPLARAVDMVVILLHGAGASLEFTGDIPTEDYSDIIRPRMTPPLVPDTFSGLLSSDHRRLVALLREMQPAFSELHDRLPNAHGRIAAALGSVYDAHHFVCDRLVGKSPSLMMASASKRSGAEQIQRFKALRMKVFEVGEPAAATTLPETSPVRA